MEELSQRMHKSDSSKTMCLPWGGCSHPNAGFSLLIIYLEKLWWWVCWVGFLWYCCTQLREVLYQSCGFLYVHWFFFSSFFYWYIPLRPSCYSINYKYWIHFLPYDYLHWLFIIPPTTLTSNQDAHTGPGVTRAAAASSVLQRLCQIRTFSSARVDDFITGASFSPNNSDDYRSITQWQRRRQHHQSPTSDLHLFFVFFFLLLLLPP